MHNWFLLIVGSAVTLGMYDFCKKHAVSGNRVMPVLFLATLSGTLFMIAMSAASGNLLQYYHCTMREWWLVMAKSTIVAASWIAGYFALHDLPISIASPIRASAPVWAVLGGICLFGERPSWLQFFGMAIVFIGYYLFSNIGRLEGFSWKSRGIQMVIAATLIGAGSALYDKFLMSTLHLNPNMVQLHFSIDLVYLLGLAWLFQRWIPFMKEQQPFRWRWSIIAIGIFLICADWLFFHAIAEPGTQIGMLSVIRRCSVIVSFACGAWYFGEKDISHKAAALALVLGGVILLGFAK